VRQRKEQPVTDEGARGTLGVPTEGGGSTTDGASRITRSVFGPVFAGREGDLPPVFREEFLLAADADYDLVLEGTMERIWHRPWWLWPILWLMGRTNTLFPDTGRDVPFRLVIANRIRPDGTLAQSWQRTFAFKAPRRFDSELAFDERRGRVVEWVGPGGCVEVGSELVVHRAGILVMTTNEATVRVGRWRWRLPGALGVQVQVVHEAVPDKNAARVALTVRQKVLGPIFGYKGSFRMRREPPAVSSTRVEGSAS
jgi:hypothetical protein